MSIKQRAEAAANDIVSRLSGCGLDSVDAGVFAEIIQAAIDEATAPLRARIAALEGLGPLIETATASLTEYISAGDENTESWAFGVYHKAMEDIHAILKGGAP